MLIICDILEYLCPPQTHNPQTGRRRPDRSIETGAERPSKRARLTEKNLKAFEKMERPRKSDGKKSTGHSSSTGTTTNKESKSRSSGSQPKSSDSESKSTRSKETISTTDSGFQEAAFQNGILDPNYSKPPANLGHRQDRLERARDTASPSESDYRYFASAIRSAPNEASVLYETSTLLKRYDEPGYHKRFNQSFSNFPKNVGFNNGLSAAQPDMIEGINMPEFEPFPVREQLGGAATVYPGLAATTLPHLAGEWKGPGKDMILAQTQAAYDAACMVYGRNEACSFLGSPDPAGHAYVQTFTTDGTTLNTFAHYSTKSQGQVKYHQYPTSSSFLISGYENFKQSRRRLRNQQDDAKEYSEKLRDKLNEKWSANQHQPPAATSVPTANVQQYQPPVSTAPPAETVDVRYGYDYGDQGDGEARIQLLVETEYYASFNDQNGYNPPDTEQPLSSDYEYGPTDTALGYDPTDRPQVLTTDDGYNPDTSHAQNYDPPVTPPYSSENVSLPLESHESVDDSNTHGHRRSRRSRVPIDNSKARKTRRR